MKTALKHICIGLALSLLPLKALRCEPITYYFYLTNYETTRFGEIIWFWNVDTLWGPVRSNDFIGIKYSPQFFGPVITSRDRFIYNHPRNIYFAYPPVFNAPPYRFPRTAETVRRYATPLIYDRDGRLMTWIKLRGNEGIDIHQYPLGSAPRESLIWGQGPSYGQCIFVDGQVEIEGTLTGVLTIGSSGDMWLVDNVIYTGSDQRTGYFGNDTPDEGGMRNMLGLISERNIIIQNNWRNGKENGWYVDRNDYNRHSIAINGSLVALNESFTFQHHNDNWDLYQGPTPDERGYIFLKGGVAQWRRGYLHCSNHIGTGYNRAWRYDHRLIRQAPPGFAPGEYPDLSGNYGRVRLWESSYYIRDCAIDTLEVDAGAELNLEGNNALTIGRSLTINGRADKPVIIKPSQHFGHAMVQMRTGRFSKVRMQHTQSQDYVEWWLQADTLRIDNCRFGYNANFEGNAEIDSCRFNGRLVITSWECFSLTRSVAEGGVTISGGARAGRIMNNTIVNYWGAGLELRRFGQLTISDNIIAFNGRGILNETHIQPVLTYNDVFDNGRYNYEGCQPDVGSFSADPRFVDLRRKDFSLQWNSPCIDVGDPSAPRDPDGSRADIGAIWHNRRLYVNDIDRIDGIDEMNIIIMPNPFNRATDICLAVPERCFGDIGIYDYYGRLVAALYSGELSPGRHNFRWDAPNLAAGVYFVRWETGKDVISRKVILIK